MALHYPDKLIFGIAEIDEQHEDLFEMYNDFSAAFFDGRGEEGAFRLFDRLEDVTSNHFRYEQRLMERSGYPDTKAHLQEHIQTIESFKQFKLMIGAEKLNKEMLLSIKRYLIRMLVNHVKSSDMNLCRHLTELSTACDTASNVVMTGGRKKMIGEILINSNIITRSTLELALERQKTNGQLLGRVLVEMGAVTGEDIVEACAVQLGMLRQIMS